MRLAPSAVRVSDSLLSSICGPRLCSSTNEILGASRYIRCFFEFEYSVLLAFAVSLRPPLPGLRPVLSIPPLAVSDASAGQMQFAVVDGLHLIKP
jgi:hypothetical protein